MVLETTTEPVLDAPRDAELCDPAGEDSGETPVDSGRVAVDVLPGAVSVSVTGQTVVEMAIVEVTTVVESAGQLVTEAAQLVMVISLVV